MSASDFDSLLKVFLALLILTGAFGFLRRSPKTALFAWLTVICFVPIWIGGSFHVYVPAFTAIGLMAAISLLPVPAQVQWSVADLFLLAILVVVAIELFTQTTTISAAFDAFTSWAGAYLFGRLIAQVVEPDWIYRAIAIFFTVVAALALVEFATGRNLFIQYLSNGSNLFSIWGNLIPRGGIIRAEGAFGNPIALGASLAIAVGITMGANFRLWLKSIMLAIMLGGAVVTFSRAGMLTAAIGIVLSCLFLTGILTRAYRVFLLVILGVGGALVSVYVLAVFASSGAEAEDSALYRSDLLLLLRDLNPFGLSDSYRVSSTGQVSIGSFASIDNAMLLFGLLYGWVPLLFIAALLIGAIWLVLSRRATPPTIALVAQIPSLVSVALITQYAAVLWFAAGLAVTTQVLARSAQSMRRLAPSYQVSSGVRVRRPRSSAESVVREAPVP